MKKLAILVGVLLAGTGTALGSSTSRSSTHYFVKPGQDVYVPSLDLFCKVYARNPTGESGPVMFCGRASRSTKKLGSRSVAVTNRHFIITDETGNNLAYKAARTP
jgi:hypothetical protein